MLPTPANETKFAEDYGYGPLYANDCDRLRHQRCIELIALEMQRNRQEVEPLYEEVLAYLKFTARIQDYLPIFVSRRVRYLLRRAPRN